MPRRGPDPVLTRREARQGVELALYGLSLLIEARDIFAARGHLNTTERVRAAISSAKGAVRVAEYRERKAERREIDQEAEAGAAEVEARRSRGPRWPACCLYHVTGGIAALDCGDDALGCYGPDGGERLAAAKRRVAEAAR